MKAGKKTLMRRSAHMIAIRQYGSRNSIKFLAQRLPEPGSIRSIGKSNRSTKMP